MTKKFDKIDKFQSNEPDSSGNDSIKVGNINDSNGIAIGKSITQNIYSIPDIIKREFLTRFFIVIIFIAILFLILFSYFIIQVDQGFDNFVDYKPTSTANIAELQRMPSGKFNVVIAGFGLEKSDSIVIESTISDDMSDIIYASLKEVKEIDFILGWRAEGVGRILGDTPSERENQASEIAEALNADVVIYGIVRAEEFYNILIPEFFITAAFASIEPELVGSDQFGTPIEFLKNSDDQFALAATDLQTRLSLMRLFLRGLSLYIQGEFARSREVFQDALELNDNKLDVLYIFAGNSALREGSLDMALQFYDSILVEKPIVSG